MVSAMRLVQVAVLSTVLWAGAALPASAIEARGSVEQVDVTGAKPGQTVTLKRNGKIVATDKAGALGGALFRHVKPGAGYAVADSGPLTVLPNQSAPPSTDVYNQDIPASGYGYLTTRDGTKLAYYVHPPQDFTTALAPGGSPTLPEMPYPTLIEYSGYGYANPAGAQSGIELIANVMGFAVVDVNMRGTGCSGGAFDYFEPLQG